MAWQVIITEPVIVDNGVIIIRSVLTDGVSQKIQDEYRNTNWDVTVYKAYLNAKISALSQVVDKTLQPGPFDPTQ